VILVYTFVGSLVALLVAAFLVAWGWWR